MARPLAPLTAKIENFIRMEARGESPNEILRVIFHLDPDNCSEAEKNKAHQQMYRWRHRPDAKAIWADELSATVKRYVPGAIGRISKQVGNENDWVANKAANDLITLAKAIAIIETQESALNVRIEGMPDLGTPDQEEK